ncbi:MAG: hypothetical protein RIE77_10805 [Phycisphaerales bacterium]|jgi:hypothetical protein
MSLSTEQACATLLDPAIQPLSRTYDRLYSPANLHRLEVLVMIAACAGFIVNVALIFAARRFADMDLPVLRIVNTNYFSAIYTPFSFILFYEVLMLVVALPKSLSIAVAKQYEIISLIIVRGVFKDIGELESPEQWASQVGDVLVLLADMAAALAMFALVAVFYRLRKRSPLRLDPNTITAFVSFKKAVAVVLSIIFVVVAVVGLVGWLWSVIESSKAGEVKGIDTDLIFFPRFFEILIFSDVLILIVSFSITDGYQYVFRNAGFVISTILLRISLTSPKPLDLAAALTAMGFGIAVLAIFNTYARLGKDNDAGDGPSGALPADSTDST